MRFALALSVSLVLGLVGVPAQAGYPLYAAATSPAVAAGKDGLLEMFAPAPPNAALHHRKQLPGGAWGPWAEFGTPTEGAPTVVRNAAGLLEVFALDRRDGRAGERIRHRAQLGDGTWGPWEDFGSAASAPVAAEGGTDLFAVAHSGSKLLHRARSGAGWGPWEDFGEGSGLPAVARGGDGQLRVFTTLSGQLFGRTQTPAGWSQWTPLGGPADAHSPVATATPSGVVVFVTADQRVNELRDGWTVFSEPVTGRPSVGRNADGRLEVFVVGRDASSVQHRRETATGWGPWQTFDGASAVCSPSVTSTVDGRLELFTLAPAGEAVMVRAQTAPSGTWGPAHVLGGPASPRCE
ncbi:hypothetical protein NLX83_02110 [Allokutzneria sp. A3M-2-11 16]|uniref:hypothetical protein n=1 Tax=Allokutzneria sp. A3M-2-11 16 TaxID=2962043 RepID=UPI0020B6875D|nr:hypothetical protein [Allokutzneria sp. A3M-2-11 16]MCP3798043.1 hypothetical protein [Allokutzneria sp. A3M-2-11 16]